jgi:hypothetical protein
MRMPLQLQYWQRIGEYRPGKAHQNADTLSRVNIVPITTIKAKIAPIKLRSQENEWMKLQQGHNYCQKIIENCNKIKNRKSNQSTNVNGYQINEKQELVVKYGKIVVLQIKSLRENERKSLSHVNRTFRYSKYYIKTTTTIFLVKHEI